MTETMSCPDRARLQDLLDGRLADDLQAEMNRHLETCPNCQQRLEDLAAGKETWTEAARNLNANAESASPDAGLERVMEESKREGPAQPEILPAEVPLDFLAPSDDPTHLGRLGNYEIIEVIRRGGMSVVLKAFDPSLHRVVAIKVLAPQLATSAAARTRFRREGFAAAAISHEHVVAVYGVDEVRGLPYLVMEYISGESLQERLDRDGPLELKEVLRIGMQAAQGLAAAHAQGLVHRDIKPANILLHNGVARVKITDFGLARPADDATLTQSGIVAGTPQYMSPEQARGDAIDARTDLFSLGSVLYAMCTGRPPFRASTTMGVLKRVSDESPRTVGEINNDVPSWLADVIGKLHAKNRADRFQSAAEVADLLGRHLAELQQGMLAPVSTSTTSMAPVASRRLRFRTRARVTVALLSIIAGALMVGEATGVTNVADFVATVLRINTGDGTLVIETDDPNIEVIVDGGDIRIHGAGPKEIRVRAGDHRIRAIKDGKELPIDQELVTVARDGRQIVRIRRVHGAPPPGGEAGPPVHGLPVLTHVGTLRSSVFRFHSLVFSPDAKTLFGAGSDFAAKDPKAPVASGGIVEMWQLATRNRLWFWKKPAEIKAAAFSPGSTTLATGDTGGTVRLGDVQRGDLLRTLHAGTGPVNAVAFAPDGQTLATGNSDGRVRIVRVGSGEILKRFDCGAGQLIQCLAYSPDGKILAVGGFDRPRLVPRIADTDGNMNISDKNADISTVRLFEVGSWKERALLAGHHGAVTTLAFSPDGRLLATAGADRTIRLWHVSNGKLAAAFKGHKGRVNSLAFTPDGTLLLSGADDKTVKLWDVVRRRLFLNVAQSTTVRCLALSPDGNTLAVDGTLEIKLWNIASVYAQAVQRQRLATLQQIAARTETQFKQGTASVSAVQKAKLAVLTAELELCETPLQRIAILEQILAQQRDFEQQLESLYKAGIVPESSLLQAKAKRQEAEIDLQRERARIPGPVPAKAPQEKSSFRSRIETNTSS
jgi:anti-sigma factor RsiW